MIYDAKLQKSEPFVKFFTHIYNKMGGFRYKIPGFCYFLNMALQ